MTNPIPKVFRAQGAGPVRDLIVALGSWPPKSKWRLAVLIAPGAIWRLQCTIDRMPVNGLKQPTSFRGTHLGPVGHL